jgi:hypothetical protein
MYKLGWIRAMSPLVDSDTFRVKEERQLSFSLGAAIGGSPAKPGAVHVAAA